MSDKADENSHAATHASWKKPGQTSQAPSIKPLPKAGRDRTGKAQEAGQIAMRALFVLAALLVAGASAQAGRYPVEARWCTAHTVFIDVRWDCRYPTRAICEAYAPHDRSCLENPNWNLYPRRHRR